MADDEKMAVGSVGWIDLTVPNADQVRDFYAKVVGWSVQPVDMGEYNDYCMVPPDDDDAVTGICFKRGDNANQPASWMIYIVVANLDESLAAVKALGGEMIGSIRDAGPARFCVIKDPAGATCALWQQG